MTIQEFNDLYEIATALAGYQYEQQSDEIPSQAELDTLAGKFQVQLMKLVRDENLQAPAKEEAQ